MTQPITAAMLRENDACEEEVKKFEHLFGESVIPTKELALQYADEFDWEWAADNLLSQAQLNVYTAAIKPATKLYGDAYEQTHTDYQKAVAPAKERYDAAAYAAAKERYEAMRNPALGYATDPAWAQLLVETAPQRAAFIEATRTARAAYDRAQAVAFVQAWCSEE